MGQPSPFMVVIPETGEVIHGDTKVDLVRKMHESARVRESSKYSYMQACAQRAGLWIGKPAAIRADRCHRFLRDLEVAGLITLHTQEHS